ncbi:ADP-ribosyltransferase [Nocardia sp. NPDC004711]
MVDDDDIDFDEWPWAEAALAGQGLDRLTADERDVISAYAHNGFADVNNALWGLISMTPALARRIALIRSGLAKYPPPETVRVTREADGQVYGIVDEESAAALIDAQFTHDGFLSTSGVAIPPRSMRHHDPVILDLLVPAGTPALRLGELSPVSLEHEVLLIDARSYVVVGTRMDPARNMWRIQAIVKGGDQ